MDEQAAVDLARLWAVGQPHGLRAVPGGWITWTGGVGHAPPPPGAGRRAVIDAAAERMHRWPSWDVDEIAARLAAATPGDRFPPAVQALVENAGWYEGRRIADDQLDAVAAALAALPSERPIRLHDTARAFLTEFGGLTVAPDGRPAVSFAPVPETFDAWLLDVPEDALGQHFCPVALYRDAWPSELLLGERGTALLRAGSEMHEVADDPAGAITELLVGTGDFPRLQVPEDD